MNSDEAVMDALRRSRPHEAGVIRFHHLSGGLAKYVLTAWKKKIGDHVHVRDTIAMVGTADLVLGVEVFEEGVLSELCYHPGDSIPNGAVVARLSLETPEEPIQSPLPTPGLRPGAADL